MWTEPASTFVQALERLGDVHFEPFRWTGSNSHRARCLAAIQLRQHIKNCASKYLPQDHFIIAHSHGGNVALYALRDKSMARYVSGVVCLSTPFIHCRVRDFGPAGLSPIYVLVIVFFMWLAFTGVERLFPAFNFYIITMGVACLTSACLFVAAKSFVEFLEKRFKQYIVGSNEFSSIKEPLGESFRFPALPSDSVLIVRAAGDEASAALATSHFLSLGLSGLSRTFGRLAVAGIWIMAINSRLLLKRRIKYSAVCCLAGFVLLAARAYARIDWSVDVLNISGWAFVLLSVAFGIGFLFEGIGLLAIGTVGLPLLIGIAAITIASSPFGIDTALLAPLFEISAESTPPGRFTTLELSDEQTKGLWHSTSYESEEAFREIASWIKTRGSG
jgi:hypothetical protein